MANSLQLPCKSCRLQRPGVLFGLLHVLLARQTAVAMRVSTDLTQLVTIAETLGEDMLATFNVSISAVGARGASLSGIPPYHGPPLPSGHASLAQSDYRFQDSPEAMQEAVVEIHRTPIEAKHRSSLLEVTENLVTGFISNHMKEVNLEQGSLLMLGLLTGIFFFVSAFVVWTTLNRLSEEPPPPRALSNDGLIARKGDYYERSSISSRSEASGGKANSEDEADDPQGDLGEDSARQDGKKSLKVLGDSCGNKLRKQIQYAAGKKSPAANSRLAVSRSDSNSLDIRKAQSMPAEILQYKYEPMDLSSEEEDHSSDDDFSVAPGDGDSGGDEDTEPEPETPSDGQPRERSKTEPKANKFFGQKERATKTNSNKVPKVPKPQKKMRSTWPGHTEEHTGNVLDLRAKKEVGTDI